MHGMLSVIWAWFWEEYLGRERWKFCIRHGCRPLPPVAPERVWSFFPPSPVAPKCVLVSVCVCLRSARVPHHPCPPLGRVWGLEWKGGMVRLWGGQVWLGGRCAVVWAGRRKRSLVRWFRSVNSCPPNLLTRQDKNQPEREFLKNGEIPEILKIRRYTKQNLGLVSTLLSCWVQPKRTQVEAQYWGNPKVARLEGTPAILIWSRHSHTQIYKQTRNRTQHTSVVAI